MGVCWIQENKEESTQVSISDDDNVAHLGCNSV